MQKNLHMVQALLVVVATAGFYFWQGQDVAKAAMFGGAVALANGYMLAGRMRKASEVAKTDPKTSVAVLYVGAVQRFVFTLVSLGLGLGYIKLAAMPLLVGFALPQLGFLLTRQEPIEGLAGGSDEKNSNQA